MPILLVSCIVHAGMYRSYLWYLTTYTAQDFDPYNMIAALVVVVIILSLAVGFLWRGRGDGK